jgi:hypothetical protein
MHHISPSRGGGVFVLLDCFLGLKERDTDGERERGIRVGFCCSVSVSFPLFWVLAMMLLVEEEMGVLGFRDMGRSFWSYGMTSWWW